LHAETNTEVWARLSALGARIAARSARAARTEVLHEDALSGAIQVTGVVADAGPHVAMLLQRGRTHGSREHEDVFVRLTAREAQVARLIAEGHAYAEIAAMLGLSPHTIRRHTERIFTKCEVRTRARLAAVVRDHEPPR
jgi:DNA-binding NarL/FixJ family response regulator